MASAEVMAMPVDTPAGAPLGKQQREGTAAEDAGAAQDVYVKLKSLQKHMEFLDIQVGHEGFVRGKVIRLSEQCFFFADVCRRHLSISFF